MEIYLIRHTRVAIAPGICYGHSDVPLAASFPAESQKLLDKLPAVDTWAVYSSPLQRCRTLAHRLNAEAAHLDPRLKELDFGAWEGRAWDEIGEAALHRWGADFVNTACPNGESFQQMARRVVDCWQTICQAPHSPVAVVTHAGVIRALLSHVLECPLHKAMNIALEYGSITKIRLHAYGAGIEYVNR